MRTFRLRHPVVDALQGALFQQSGLGGKYRCITSELLTNSATESVYRADTVENNSEWFVEVFKVAPEYATKAELAKLRKEK